MHIVQWSLWDGTNGKDFYLNYSQWKYRDKLENSQGAIGNVITLKHGVYIFP